MIGHMILQNALHRPVRTAITVIAVAIEVMLVIIVVGLTSGLLLELSQAHRGRWGRCDGPAAFGFDFHGVQRSPDAD